MTTPYHKISFIQLSTLSAYKSSWLSTTVTIFQLCLANLIPSQLSITAWQNHMITTLRYVLAALERNVLLLIKVIGYSSHGLFLLRFAEILFAPIWFTLVTNKNIRVESRHIPSYFICIHTCINIIIYAHIRIFGCDFDSQHLRI